ncbi:MAG TPA: hypothetical protein VIG33_13840 [Pseudobdellovibrionaceae bacterium]|jgi:hypothetical protein
MRIEKVKPENPNLPWEIPEDKVPVPSEYPESLKKLFRNRQNLQWEMDTGFQSGPIGKRKGYTLTLWSLMASTIDALLLIAMNCVFLMAFIKIIKVPIDQGLLKDFALIYLGAAWLYMITTRFFIGASIGEAACDIRLGEPRERLSPWYFLRVVFRATLIAATGVVVLPLLSLILGRDIPGIICGLKLFSLH